MCYDTENMKKFILVLNGPMCAGKSTVTSLLMKEDNIFRGSYDAVKWLISNYSADNQNHRTIAKNAIFGAITSAVHDGLSIIVDGGFNDFRDKYKSLADQNNYIYLSLNIEAPIEILENRFLERLDTRLRGGTKNMSVTTLEGFHSRYRWYVEKNKDLNGITLDSSKLSAEEFST
jgi:shikimate kinase